MKYLFHPKLLTSSYIQRESCTYQDMIAYAPATSTNLGDIAYAAVLNDFNEPSAPIRIDSDCLWLAEPTANNQVIIVNGGDPKKLTYLRGGFFGFRRDYRRIFHKLRSPKIQLRQDQLVNTCNSEELYALQVVAASETSSVALLSYLGIEEPNRLVATHSPLTAKTFGSRKSALSWWTNHFQTHNPSIDVVVVKIKTVC